MAAPTGRSSREPRPKARRALPTACGSRSGVISVAPARESTEQTVNHCSDGAYHQFPAAEPPRRSWVRRHSPWRRPTGASTSLPSAPADVLPSLPRAAVPDFAICSTKPRRVRLQTRPEASPHPSGSVRRIKEAAGMWPRRGIRPLACADPRQDDDECAIQYKCRSPTLLRHGAQGRRLSSGTRGDA